MVLQKRSQYRFNGYQVPTIPQVPKSAKGKRSVRKKAEDKQMCAFNMLAAVAGKLLLEGENPTTLRKITGISSRSSSGDTFEQEQANKEKPFKDEAFDLRSCNESTLGSDFVVQRPVSCTLKECSQTLKATAPGPTSIVIDTSYRNACTERHCFGVKKLCESIVKDGNRMPLPTERQMTELDRNASEICKLEDPIEVDTKLPALASSHSSVNLFQCEDHTSGSSSFPKCRNGVELAIVKDDDENSSGCTHPSIQTNKALKPQVQGNPRIRKLLATKIWKAAPTSKVGEIPYTDEMKPFFRRRNFCYTRQRTRRSSFKRRKLFERCSVSSSDGRINREANRMTSSIMGQISSYESKDFHVKLSIKSFKVPELVIEIPETSTIGMLKRTVMEAVTAILGGRLHVGVLLQGKKVRDDNKTLLKAGISHGDKLDDLGFTLEPSPMQVPPLLPHPRGPHSFRPCDATASLTGFPIVAHESDGGKSDVSPEPPLASVTNNCLEGDHDSALSPTSTSSLDITAVNAQDLIAIPSRNIEGLPMVPGHKLRCCEAVQRRIRRPFSVSEVEALVQAVEKIGTGRWRDVKLLAFDNARHRTYVDLKDKWKTLVHTARIPPQQRRGEPVPHELLDRVLSAHAYWSQQQAKLQVKMPSTETCLLL